ncbi:MAG TPA: hypothetical protein VKV16_03640 [Solirubrobacteraceae bacterium]|nr:hypothetical protein [Solirubrobacteraceae bacterium]
MSAPLQSAAALGASATGLPVVDQALEPAWVRHGSAATQKAYASALAFEQTLVEELSQSLAASSGLGGEASQEGAGGGAGEEESSSSASDTQLSAMLPQALAGGVMHAGGLGLAAQMTRELEGSAASAGGQRTGGAAA